MKGKRIVVTWHTAVIKYGKTRLSLGLCGKTECVSFIAVFNPNQTPTQESLKTIILQDVYVENDHCEDGHSCANLSCSLNRANLQNFNCYGIKTKEDLERLHQALEKWKTELELKTEPEGGIRFYEKPLGIFHKGKKPKE